MNHMTKALLPAALLVLSFSSHAETSNGQNFAISAGWAHIMPQGKQQGVTSTYVTGAVTSTPEAGFELDNSDTAEFKFDYLVNDNVSLGLIVGVPPTFDIQGKGSLLKGISPALPNGLNLNKRVGDVKVYSPVVTGKYTFGTVNNKFRPYVGAGFMYAHFSDFKLDSSVADDPNLLRLGGSIRNVKIDDAVAPVAFIGADYNITKNWFATASVSYVHLNTRAKLDVYSGSNKFVTGETKIEINPIVTYLGLGYRF
ncbi:OmpW family outer membrane protein [Acinetobacter sp.]|uniref:OmpW/AlkL family protein n=1 Tax=Acinetobacter sp. TaxID=472 RepID=UPI0031DB7EA1